MKIDGNEIMKKENKMSKEPGNSRACYDLRKSFLKQIEESGEDFCNCKVKCPHHGKCIECVLIHRGHEDHVPFCMQKMINDRIAPVLGLTENTLLNTNSEDSKK